MAGKKDPLTHSQLSKKPTKPPLALLQPLTRFGCLGSPPSSSSQPHHCPAGCSHKVTQQWPFGICGAEPHRDLLPRPKSRETPPSLSPAVTHVPSFRLQFFPCKFATLVLVVLKTNSSIISCLENSSHVLLARTVEVTSRGVWKGCHSLVRCAHQGLGCHPIWR